MLNQDKNQTNSFVDFYDESNFLPVSQKDTGSEIHELRRRRLFTSLSVPPSAIRGSRVLEIGPGGGANAELLLRFNPYSLTLLDGSSTAVTELKARFMQDNVTIIQGDFLSEIPDESFDLIIAEGCLPGQKIPGAVLSKMSEHVAINGQIIFTTQTSVSLLAEILRRIITKVVLENSKATLENKVDVLVAYFKPSLDSLIGMSRPYKDWVVDVLIHPWENGCHVFTADQALEAVGKNFDVVACRPELFLDQSWYKQDLGGFSNKTLGFKARYTTASAILIDYRLNSPSTSELSVDEAELLEARCASVYILHNRFNPKSEKDSQELLKELRLISDLIQSVFPQTYNALMDFIESYPKLLANPTTQVFGSFHEWFGRGQQYLSIIRNY